MFWSINLLVNVCIFVWRVMCAFDQWLGPSFLSMGSFLPLFIIFFFLTLSFVGAESKCVVCGK